MNEHTAVLDVLPWEVEPTLVVYGFACVLLLTFLRWFVIQLLRAQRERDS